MGYEIYSDHPESQTRKAADFSAWTLWAPENAPWTGVSVSDMASMVQAVCAAPGSSSSDAACTVLDQGGLLQPTEVRTVVQRAGHLMPEAVREVFNHAGRSGYPVRVVFSKGFGSMAASAYLAKHGSA